MHELLHNGSLLSAEDRALLSLAGEHDTSRKAIAGWMGITQSGLAKRFRRLMERVQRIVANDLLERRWRLSPADRRVAELYFIRGLSLRGLISHPMCRGQSLSTLSRRVRRIEAKLLKQ